MAKVSIIMPSLNVAEYIEESIESARRQTLEDIEIICVDAGSSDGTWRIIHKAAKSDSRIVAIQSPIKSYGYQVNVGIGKSTGQYIAILETDDFIVPKMYELLLEAADRDNLDYVKCDYSTYVTESEGRKFIERKVSDNSVFYDKPFLPSDYPQTVIDDWYLWNGIYNADFIKENNIRFSETPGAAFQDVGFLHKVAVNAHRGKYIKESLYRYCVDREGASSNSDKILRFIRKEYGLILDGMSECANHSERILLYRRMARSFVRACMDSSNDLLIDPQINDICKWFHRQLHDAERWGYICEEDMPVSLREGYRHIMNPVNGFIAYRKVKESELKEFLGENNPIIIFGCGNYGRDALKRLNSNGYVVTGFMDNNKSLWGGTIDGFPVFSTDNIEGFDRNTRYIVANEKYALDIIAQLKKIRNDALTYEFVPEK